MLQKLLNDEVTVSVAVERIKSVMTNKKYIWQTNTIALSA